MEYPPSNPCDAADNREFGCLAICAESLGVSRGERILFSDLSFRIQAGSASILTGSNGTGKTTLLRMISFLLAPGAGRVRLEGVGVEDTVQTNLHYLGHQDGLRDALTPVENLRYQKALLGREESGLAVEAALQYLKIAELADLPVGLLSAGQRRRVALAALLAVGRRIWLLDEPLNGLDAAACELVGQLCSEHCRAGGILVLATHVAVQLDLPNGRIGRLELQG